VQSWWKAAAGLGGGILRYMIKHAQLKIHAATGVLVSIYGAAANRRNDWTKKNDV
jgi:hypothetical protein